MAVGFAISTFLIAREQANTQAAYDRLDSEQKQTKAAYDRADENFKQARRMLDVFTQMSEEEPASLEEARKARRRILEAALDYYQDFIEKHQEDSSIRKELAASLQRVANLLYETGYRQHAGHLRGGHWLFLLTQPSVQAELHLSEEQLERVGQLSQRRWEAFRKKPQVPEEVRAIDRQLNAEEEAFVYTLRRDQAQRLKEIAWQHGDLSSLRDPELADALKLTAEQREEIHEVQEQARRAWRQARREERPPSPSWTTFRERILAILSDEQKAKWKELCGKEFKGEIRSPFRRPGPGGERASSSRP
jgi:hypothetical protein